MLGYRLGLVSLLCVSVISLGGPPAAAESGKRLLTAQMTLTPGSTLRCSAVQTAALVERIFGDEFTSPGGDLTADPIRLSGFGTFTIKPRVARTDAQGELRVDELPPIEISPGTPFASSEAEVAGDDSSPLDVMVLIEVKRTDLPPDQSSGDSSDGLGPLLIHLSCSDPFSSDSAGRTVKFFNASKGFGFITPENGATQVN